MPPKVEAPNTVTNLFGSFAKALAQAVGSPWAFIASVAVVAVWMATGPIFRYSNAWQLIVNSLTNIITFFVVFLIQNSQNRDSKALHLKLDEVIRAIAPARNDMIDIEKFTDDELKSLEAQYERIRAESERRQLRGREAA